MRLLHFTLIPLLWSLDPSTPPWELQWGSGPDQVTRQMNRVGNVAGLYPQAHRGQVGDFDWLSFDYFDGVAQFVWVFDDQGLAAFGAREFLAPEIARDMEGQFLTTHGILETMAPETVVPPSIWHMVRGSRYEIRYGLIPSGNDPNGRELAQYYLHWKKGTGVRKSLEELLTVVTP